MTRRYHWIPELLTRITHEDVQEQGDHGEGEDTPDADLDCHEHSKVSLTVRDEDPEILEKDGELDEEDSWDVDNYSGIKPLAATLASPQAPFAMSYLT